MKLRITVPNLFPRYFQLILPHEEITNSEFWQLLGLAYHPETLASDLRRLAEQESADEITRAHAFFRILHAYAETESFPQCISSIVRALFIVGDEILLKEEGQPRGFFDPRRDLNMLIPIIWSLLRDEAEQSRFDILRAAMRQGQAVTLCAMLLAGIGQQHGKFGAKESLPETQRFIDWGRLRVLEELTLEKIRHQELELVQRPKLPDVLAVWQELAGREEVIQWAKRCVETDEGLCKLLERFTVQVQGVNELVRPHISFDNRLFDLIPRSAIIDRRLGLLGLLEDNSLTSGQRALHVVLESTFV